MLKKFVKSMEMCKKWQKIKEISLINSKKKKYFGKEGNDEKLNKEKNEKKKYRYGW